MRRRLQLGPRMVFALAFLLALIVLLPMRLVLAGLGLDDQGLAARRVTGPVWAGRLDDARFGDLALGDLSAGVAPLPLIVGRARIDLRGRTPGTDTQLRGALGVSRHSFGLDDVTAGVATGSVFAPLPVSRLDLDDVSVRFDGGRCVRAAGRVRAALSGSVAVPLPATMSGTARCAGADLLLPLVGQAGSEAVNLHIRADGGYRADLIIQPGDPATAQALAVAGFVAEAGGSRLSINGHF